VTHLVRVCPGALAKDPDERTDSIGAARQTLEEEIAERTLPAAVRDRESRALPRNNLPTPISRFIGRRLQLREIPRFLAECRLVTLTGAGGSGKSRLALEIGREMLGRFPDGVWLVELAPLGRPELVARAVAGVLDLKEEAGRSCIETVIDHLERRALLLILDNCEHLLESCADFVARVLASRADVRVLATSREAFGIPGETVCPIPPLALPDPHAADLEALAAVEAVQLFLDRAASALPGFQLSPQSAPSVIRICRDLDGLPLAIELAAARVKAMPAEVLASRLGDRFHLLTGGIRTALPHHQTLNASIEWSYDLLSPEEQTLLCRLSIFAGAWSLESAEAICAGEGIEAWAILDLLTRLVEKSLIDLDPEGSRESSHVRYQMLETVRQYSRGRLVRSGGERDVGKRHRDYFVDLAERAEPHLTGSSQAEWLRRLETEHDNLRVALNLELRDLVEEPSTPGDDDVQEALRLAGALGRFWGIRGYWSEGREVYRRLLDLPAARSRTAARAKALNWAGNLAQYQGEYAEACACHEECLAISTEIGDRWRMASALNNLGIVAGYKADYTLSRRYHERSLAIRREVGDPWAIALSLMNLGGLSAGEGNSAEARVRLEEGLALFRSVGDRLLEAADLVLLSSAARPQGECGEARRALEIALDLFRKAGDPWGTASAINHLGLVALVERNLDLARDCFVESLLIRRDLGDRQAIAESLASVGLLETDAGKSQRAIHLLGAASAVRSQISARLSPVEQAELTCAETALRSRLGEAPFDEEWRAGLSLPLGESIALALESGALERRAPVARAVDTS
jgi:non-specific serine/threonine protein kinase